MCIVYQCLIVSKCVSAIVRGGLSENFKGVCLDVMGAQNTKERTGNIGTHSIRTARTRPRPLKDGRQIISNIFTEHSGMGDLFLLFLLFYDTCKLAMITCQNRTACFDSRELFYLLLRDNERRFIKC